MGLTQHNQRKVRLNPTFGLIHQIGARRMMLPPSPVALPNTTTPLTSIALNQTFNSLAANAAASPFLSNGATGSQIFTNPMLLNGTAGGAGTFGIVQGSGVLANRGVYLDIPAVASFQAVIAAAVITWRIRGINHLGQDYLRSGFTETILSNGFGFGEGGMCWQYIDTIEILSYTGAGTAGTDNISVGWANQHNGYSANRLPLPWDAGDAREVAGVVLLTPGTSGVFATWTVGQMVFMSTGASASGTANFSNSTARFATGNMTTLGTTPVEYWVIPTPGAINAH